MRDIQGLAEEVLQALEVDSNNLRLLFSSLLAQEVHYLAHAQVVDVEGFEESLYEERKLVQ